LRRRRRGRAPRARVSGVDAATRAAREFVADITAVIPFGGGHIHETFLVAATQGEFVLQRMNTAVFADPDAVLHNIVAVHDHLEGALVPHLVGTRAGAWLVRDAVGTWRAWRRVPDAAPLDAITPATTRSAGRLLGRFHALL